MQSYNTMHPEERRERGRNRGLGKGKATHYMERRERGPPSRGRRSGVAQIEAKEEDSLATVGGFFGISTSRPVRQLAAQCMDRIVMVMPTCMMPRTDK